MPNQYGVPTMSNSKINVDLATLNEINDFLYDPYFKDDIKGIRDFAEAYAKATFNPVEIVCVGIGYKNSDNSSSSLYLHNPETGFFQKYYESRFEYPRVGFWNYEHYKNEHRYWLTYGEIVSLCNLQDQSTETL